MSGKEAMGKVGKMGGGSVRLAPYPLRITTR